jgi:hypothetical protein
LADGWVLVIWLIVTTALIRAAGPVALGGRQMPERANAVIALLAPAILAALVMTETFGTHDSELVLDERALGVAAAGGALLLRAPLLLTLAIAMAVTAGARALI